MAKKKNKKKKQKKEFQKVLFSCILLSILVMALGYIIVETDFLEPHINELTASYISFNNKNTTDMLKITNIEKMTDSKGKSSWNKKSLKFDILGEDEKEYEIVLYALANDIPNSYIYYYLGNPRELVCQSLENLEESKDGGKVLYRGTIDNSSMVLRLWISKEYEKTISENSFEIKIKPR